MILGTAGHVDHGKTALVRALTGVDTDRLAEEKRRGITIDLGFAPLRIDDDLTIGVVDVPGHEAFVRNMLAGATGVDLALLVVAADEGVMPQTREHLAILRLLGVRGGVIALTKTDLVDAEWLGLVREELDELVAGTPLEGAPAVGTSVVTGDGIAALREAITRVARAAPSRQPDDLFRLPVDRSFTVRGTGTVVTGTVWSGMLRRDETVRLMPGSRRARVRGVESHGAPVAAALPGMRSAIALAGIDVGDVGRGTVLVTDPSWRESRTLLADVTLLAPDPPIGPRTALRFHLGTSEVGARVIARRETLSGAEPAPARIALDEPVVARAGDRFVLRGGSPLVTVGGGVVVDPTPEHRRSRANPAGRGDARERLRYALAAAGTRGIETASLPVRIGLRPDEAAVLAGMLPDAVQAGDRLYEAPVVAQLVERLREFVRAHHADNPLEDGASLQSVRARLGASSELAEEVVRRSLARGDVEIAGPVLRECGWAPRLTAAEERASADLRAALERAGREPPGIAELSEERGPTTASLLRLLERTGVLVQVDADRYYVRSAVEEMIAALRGAMQPGREYGPPELRDILGFSRKFLIPFLEYCDRAGITERRPGGRVIIAV
ncbi:MAG: selenocysteine-specific translation elongation factor [Gemmatimonadaceae bacterium]